MLFRSYWLYVTYAPTNVFGPGVTGPGRGFVDVFTINGVLQHRLQNGFWMNAPWGVTMAPTDFGRVSNRVLVGMFGSGAIATFDPLYGTFRGFMRNTDGLPVVISKGLWGLGFGNGSGAGATNTLYFASDFQFAGVFHGLFGTLTPAPAVPGIGGGGEGDQGGNNNDQGENNNEQ